MLKNYFKIAIAVLKRRKFFTFISLFGISFTLTVLIIASAFIDHTISPAYPETKRARSLYIQFLEKTNDKHSSINKGPLSIYFLNTYVKTMKTPEKVGICSYGQVTNTYVNNQKLELKIRYVNTDFWQVTEFLFIDGRAFNDQELANADHVAVITESTRNKYFGENVNAIGKYIETDNENYRVTGIVKDAPVSFGFTHGDIYLPYTTSKTDITYHSLNGQYSAILLAKDKSDIPAIQKEYQAIIDKKPMLDKGFTELYSFADTYFTNHTRMEYGKFGDSGLTFAVTALSLIAFLFMLLPSLNLININISRIMERSSEIGVRKAFGASSRTLVYQFIIENLILTAIGCIVGIVIACIVLAIVNSSGWIPGIHLSVNLTVLAVALLCCIIFGLLTGVYPAWRMSRLQIVNALKA